MTSQRDSEDEIQRRTEQSHGSVPDWWNRRADSRHLFAGDDGSDGRAGRTAHFRSASF